MRYQHSVADHVVPAKGTVSPTDSLEQVRRLMDAVAQPTLIVAHSNRPIGVIRKADVDAGLPVPDRPLAADVMESRFPTITPEASPSVAQAALETANLDSLPVVNADGELIGVVSREAVRKTMDAYHHDERPFNRPARPLVRRAFNVRPSMNVYSKEGFMLGLIDRMYMERGRVSGFLVSYGLLHRKHKQLPFDDVDHLEDKAIFLSIRQHVFHQLPDADPQSI